MDSTGLYVLFEALHKHTISDGGHLAAVIDTNSRRAIPELHLVALEQPLTCATTWPKLSTPVPTLTQTAGAGIRWRSLGVLCKLDSSRGTWSGP